MKGLDGKEEYKMGKGGEKVDLEENNKHRRHL